MELKALAAAQGQTRPNTGQARRGSFAIVLWLHFRRRGLVARALRPKETLNS